MDIPQIGHQIRGKRSEKMIIFVCGMIGSGKTTYAESKDGVVSDWDVIGNKADQILYTMHMHELGKTVYHITCYPTGKELELLEGKIDKFIWINTRSEQCMINVRHRGRKRDMDHIEDVKKRNSSIQAMYRSSKIKFEVIDIFETDERW